MISVVAYITKSKLSVYNTENPASLIFESPWDEHALTGVFSQLKKKMGIFSMRVILGNTMHYVLCMKLKSEQLNRAGVLAAVRSLVPEDVLDENFDWKIAGFLPDTQMSLVQVVVVPLPYLIALSTAASQSHITVDEIESIAVLLAQEAAAQPKPHIILWSNIENIAAICFQGIVYFMESFELSSKERLLDMIEFIRESFNLRIGSILTDLPESSGQPTALMPETIPPTPFPFHPVSFFASRKHQTGQDQSILQIKLPAPKKSEIVHNPAHAGKPIPYRLIFLVGILSVLLIVAGIVLGRIPK